MADCQYTVVAETRSATAAEPACPGATENHSAIGAETRPQINACLRVGGSPSRARSRMSASLMPSVCCQIMAHTTKYTNWTTMMVNSTPDTWTAGVIVARATGNGHIIIAANTETKMSMSDWALRGLGG